ncbi:uncharacterized protein LOC113236784 [Hyposmocoma kahamanoa]|uniref:uncharacterized protein LOC113236784 n=1 Tax=Hyposmocoma kahamanoa TaxID=1477025 RepID=UPI000E6D81E9|nr:uncharacterized protein LOC113236784 [Hyposmocoma kahamanoa]
MKTYTVVGNKKKVTMEVNGGRLKIVGNSCVVRVSNNQGNIEVIGNDSRVEVADNYGAINLVGNNGLVTVDKRWKGDSVQIIGSHGHIIVKGKEKRPQSFESQLSPFSKELDDVIESIFTFVIR